MAILMIVMTIEQSRGNGGNIWKSVNLSIDQLIGS